MRLGKRSLAGLAAGALGLSLIPFVGVGAASANGSAPTITAASLDGPLRVGAGFEQKVTVTGTNFDDTTQDLVVVPNPTNPGSAVSITGEDIKSATEAIFTVGGATAAGNYQLRVCIVEDGTSDCAAPLAQRNVTFSPTGIPTSMALTPSSVSTAAGADAEFTLELRDASGNRTQADDTETVAVSASGDASIDDTSALQSGLDEVGRGKFTASNASVATSTITVSATGSLFADSVTATLTTGPVVAAATVKLITPAPNSSNEIPTGSTPVTFEITRAADDTGTFFTYDVTNGTPASGAVAVGAGGKATVVVTPTATTAGATVALESGGETRTITFRAPAAEVAPSAPIVTVAPGGTVTLTGKVETQFGVPVANAVVTGSVSGANTTTTTNALTGADGTYSVSYVATAGAAGASDTVTLTAAAGSLGNPTANVTVSITETGFATLSDLVLGSTGVSTADFKSTVQVPFEGVVDAGVTGASGNTGNAVELGVTSDAGNVSVTYTATGGVLTEDAPGATTLWDSGKATVTVTANTPVYFFSTAVGSASVTVTAGGNSLSATIPVAATPADGARNLSIVADPAIQSVGGSSSLTLRVADVFGNPVRLAGGSDPTISMSTTLGAFGGGSSIINLGATNADGEVSVALISPVAGIATVTALGTGGQFATDIPKAGAPEPGLVQVDFTGAPPVEKALFITAYRTGGTVVVDGDSEGFERRDLVDIRVAKYNNKKKKWRKAQTLASVQIKKDESFGAAIVISGKVRVIAVSADGAVKSNRVQVAK